MAKALDAIGDASGRKAVQTWVDAAARVLPYATVAPRWNPAVRPEDVPAAPGAVPPTAEPGDVTESARLATLATADPASTKAALLAERRSGIVPAITHPRTAMVAARVSAEVGDSPAFRQEFGRAINAWLATSYQREPDVTLAMPARAEACAAAVSTACDVPADRALAVPADRRDMARAVALLARWSATRGLPTEADHCVALAAQLAPEQGEHTLWIADALLAIGRSEDAGWLVRALFHAGRLPLMRIAEWAEQPSASRTGTSATAPAGVGD